MTDGPNNPAFTLYCTMLDGLKQGIDMSCRFNSMAFGLRGRSGSPEHDWCGRPEGAHLTGQFMPLDLDRHALVRLNLYRENADAAGFPKIDNDGEYDAMNINI